MGGATINAQGYYSILRWRTDVARDESKNVAILLVDAEGMYGGIRYAPVSSISSRLHDQGLLDQMIVNLARQFEGANKPTVQTLRELSHSLSHSLYLTEPLPTALPNPDGVLKALYSAYVSPRGGGGQPLSKGKILDRVISALRRQGRSVSRGQYIGDFIFDVTIEDESRASVMGILSFAAAPRNLINVEYEAGHFLYGLDRVDRTGIAVMQKPPDARPEASASYLRVENWMNERNVQVLTPDEVAAGMMKLPVGA